MRRSDGDLITVNTHEIDGNIHTTSNVDRASRRGRQPLRTAKPNPERDGCEFTIIG